MDDDISRWHADNPGVFEEWVNTWQDMVYHTALGMLMQAADAEDVAQEVLVALYKNAHTFRGDAKLSTWLYRITIHKCIDHLRLHNRKKRWWGTKDEPHENELVSFDHPGILAEKKEHAVALFQAMKHLPNDQRSAFVLCKMEGLSLEEMATVLNRSTSAAESLLNRANLNLRKILKNYYEEQVNIR